MTSDMRLSLTMCLKSHFAIDSLDKYGKCFLSTKRFPLNGSMMMAWRLIFVFIEQKWYFLGYESATVAGSGWQIMRPISTTRNAKTNIFLLEIGSPKTRRWRRFLISYQFDQIFSFFESFFQTSETKLECVEYLYKV